MSTENNQLLSDQVGNELRLIRKKEQLTIEELASLSGVSAITISNIENGRSNPTLNSLWKLANSLQIPLSKLLGFSQNETTISSANEKAPSFINDLENGWVVQPVFQEDNVEVYRVCLKGKSHIKRTYQTQNSTEIVTVMTGELELVVGTKHYTLNTYDSINFDSSLSHEYINNSTNDIYLTIVVKY